MPGTVAAALGPDVDLDGQDWWFRTTFPATGDERALVFEGLATICDVYLNGELAGHSESMFVPLRIDLAGHLRAENELAVCCRALAPRLAQRRRPRARWRTVLVSEGNLRFFRTMLLGRAPGFAPGPAVVGPWRPVRLERGAGPLVDELAVRPRLDGDAGVLSVRLRVRADEAVGSPAAVTAELRRGDSVVHAKASPAGPLAGRLEAAFDLRVPDVARWWPHTHGQPALYNLTLRLGDDIVYEGRVGFRSLQWPPDWEGRGLALSVNQVPVFCRGAVWTPPGLERPDGDATSLRATLTTVRDTGLNMLRIPGIGAYESDAFHDLCDELGILVWQDFMFANLDYPDADPEFMATVETEVRHQLGRLAGRPSLAVLCGGSECAQQVTMLGLDPELARGPLYMELLPRLIAEVGIEVPYVPNAPWGGELPFRPAGGVANYYGVGAYRRPLSDARLAGVGFAAECLAFSNIPDDEALEGLTAAGVPAPHHPAWKAGVPRDAGAGWDFEDVRDHYLRELYDQDPVEVRWADPGRYLELGRMVTGEVMAETFGEWRRPESPCAGGLVLWLRDLRPGAGWGLLDHRGDPKPALWHVRRALAPVAVWLTDEGLAGMAVHLANDTAEPVAAHLRLACYRDGDTLVEQVRTPVVLAPHSVVGHDVESMLGRFIDLSWAYRFGPPAQDVVVATLEQGEAPGEGLVSQAFRFPAGRPQRPGSAAAFGVQAVLVAEPDGGARLRIAASHVLHGVRVLAPGFSPSDDAFSVEPGGFRELRLDRRPDAGDREPVAVLTALNLRDRVRAVLP